MCRCFKHSLYSCTEWSHIQKGWRWTDTSSLCKFNFEAEHLFKHQFHVAPPFLSQTFCFHHFFLDLKTHKSQETQPKLNVVLLSFYRPHVPHVWGLLLCVNHCLTELGWRKIAKTMETACGFHRMCRDAAVITSWGDCGAGRRTVALLRLVRSSNPKYSDWA